MKAERSILEKVLNPCFGFFSCFTLRRRRGVTSYDDPRDCPVARECLDKYFARLPMPKTGELNSLLKKIKKQIEDRFLKADSQA